MGARRVSYVDLKISNRAGQATQVLGALARGGVNLLAFTGFPDKGGKSQVDLVTDDMAGVRRVAKREGWRLGKTKRGLLVQGKDRVGAGHGQIKKRAGRRINITAVDAVTTGKRQYGMILWVKPKDYKRAARALRAR